MRSAVIPAIIAIILLLLLGCAYNVAAPAASESSLTPSVEDTDSFPPETKPPDCGETKTPQASSEILDGELIRVLDYIPSIYVELKYATADNFTGTVIYDFSEAHLRYGTVKKLADVQQELTEKGYSLKIWDAYRPTCAQFRLWEVYPDSRYVANPNTGYSNHSCGNTVDVTLVSADGSEIEMPSGFDEFTSLADRDYSDISDMAKGNVLILENAMSVNGFNCYSGEWWHYSEIGRAHV